MTHWHKFPTHAITSTTSSDMDIVIKGLHFLSEITQWSNTDLKALNVRWDILCDIDMTFCYVFSAMKTVSLVSEV